MRYKRFTRLVLVALPMAVLAAACVDQSTGYGGSDPASDAKATAGAMRPATPTPIPPDRGVCPPGVDAATCRAANALAGQAAGSLSVQPVTVTCPPVANWLIAMEPVCQQAKAGQAVSGFALDAKVFSFVDEATFRARLAELRGQTATVTGIACPKASETVPLDCSGTFIIFLATSTPDIVALDVRHTTDGPAVFGARHALDPNVSGGGWVSTAHAGLEEYLPSRMWMIPWQPR